MLVLVSFHKVPLLIFNDLVQTHLAVGWKASEITDSCRFDENRCLGGEGQDTCNSSLWEGEPGGFSSHLSALRMLEGKAGGEMVGDSQGMFWTWQKCRFTGAEGKGPTGDIGQQFTGNPILLIPLFRKKLLFFFFFPCPLVVIYLPGTTDFSSTEKTFIIVLFLDKA